MATIVRCFVEPIARELPMECALELNRLSKPAFLGRCPHPLSGRDSRIPRAPANRRL
jgi:hypothetical protein